MGLSNSLTSIPEPILLKMINNLARTKLGVRSIKSIIVFFIAISVFSLLVYSGQRGGDTFFSNPYLTVPILTAAFAGLVSLVAGAISIVRDKERSFYVYISTAIGAFVTWFASAEILFPH